MSATVVPGHRPGLAGYGLPRRPSNDSPAESAAVAGLRRGGAAAAYVGSWVNRLPAASTQATGCPGLARGRRPLHHGWLRVGVRVGLLIPKATERLFKLEARYALMIHPADCGDGVAGPPRVRVNSGARACPAKSSKATAVCKPPRLIVYALLLAQLFCSLTEIHVRVPLTGHTANGSIHNSLSLSRAGLRLGPARPGTGRCGEEGAGLSSCIRCPSLPRARPAPPPDARALSSHATRRRKTKSLRRCVSARVAVRCTCFIMLLILTGCLS
jgi:hypothetical protein